MTEEQLRLMELGIEPVDHYALIAEVRRLRAGVESAMDTMASSQPELAYGELAGLLSGLATAHTSPSRVR